MQGSDRRTGGGLWRQGRAGAGHPHAQRHGRQSRPAAPDAAYPDAAVAAGEGAQRHRAGADARRLQGAGRHRHRRHRRRQICRCLREAAVIAAAHLWAQRRDKGGRRDDWRAQHQRGTVGSCRPGAGGAHTRAATAGRDPVPRAHPGRRRGRTRRAPADHARQGGGHRAGARQRPDPDHQGLRRARSQFPELRRSRMRSRPRRRPSTSATRA
jgi:hypothetical protein